MTPAPNTQRMVLLVVPSLMDRRILIDALSIKGSFRSIIAMSIGEAIEKLAQPQTFCCVIVQVIPAAISGALAVAEAAGRTQTPTIIISQEIVPPPKLPSQATLVAGATPAGIATAVAMVWNNRG